MELLEAKANPFRGMVVNSAVLPGSPDEFRERLRLSLEDWRSQGYLTVWLDVPITSSALIPVAVEAGFAFHHSGSDYLQMTLQLVSEAYIPPFATHYIGAGGVVINDNRELLVVCERHRNPGQPPFYKLPGGALLAGEHLQEAVVREVLEETGVETVFESLVCFRHWHGYRYGKSDIYFVCRLSPRSHEITMQEEEIEEALWTPVDEYLGSESVSIFNKHIVRAALGGNGMAPTPIDGFDPAEREVFMPGF